MEKYAFNNGLSPTWLPKKLMMVMKLIIVLMTTCLMQVSAAGFAQKLTYVKRGATLEQIFSEIRKQTGYFVVYAEDKVDKQARLDVNFRQAQLKDVLDVVSKSQNLNYTINENNIGLKPKEESFIDRMVARFQSIDVRGKVVDSLGNGLAGATVSVKGGKQNTQTAANGDFYLKNVEEGTVLVISYLGYITKEQTVNKDFNYIVLSQSTSKLDEVQVMAYGLTSRRLSTGTITTIKATELEKQPVDNPLLVLMGRVPNLVITPASGLPGAPVKIQLRGQNSLSSGGDANLTRISEPLFVIDGVPYSNNIEGALMFGGNNQNQISALSFINPSDIESIDILSDADATSIYGSRGGSGVILITTKKGRIGHTQIDFRSSVGFDRVSNELEVMNTQQYLEMRKESFRNDLRIPQISDPNATGYAPDLLIWDQSKNTNWQKIFLGGTGKRYDINGSISGGTPTIRYLVSGKYSDQGYVYPGDNKNEKGSGHFSITGNSNDQNFQINLTGAYMVNNQVTPGSDFTRKAVTLAPNAPDIYLSNGELNWAPNHSAGNVATWLNPYASLLQVSKSKATTFNASSDISYRFNSHLQLKSTQGISEVRFNNLWLGPIAALDPSQYQFNQGMSTRRNNTVKSLTIDPQLTYSNVFLKGNFNFLVGFSYQSSNNYFESIDAMGYTDDALLESTGIATDVFVSNTSSQYRYAALFSRLNYNWCNKYLLNLTMRRDGSSRFGPGRQFGNFWSVGAGWVFTEEGFLKRNKWLSFGKIRGSYGSSGNDAIGDYQYLELYRPMFNVDYQGITPINSTGVVNPYYGWEDVRKTEVAVDLGFFNDRIIFSSGYWNTKSSNQLGGVPLPATGGAPTLIINRTAKIQNSGVDFMLTSKNINRKYFSWNTTFNLGLQRNKLLRLPLDFSGYVSPYPSGIDPVGKPFFGVVRLSTNYGVNTGTGLYQLSGRDLSVTSVASSVINNTTINLQPTFGGGISNNISYKRLDLDFFFQFTRQKGLNFIYDGAFNRPGQLTNDRGNLPIAFLDRWRKPGDVKSIQKVSQSASGNLVDLNNSAINSDVAYVDASFVRLQNIQLNYRISDKDKQKLSTRMNVFIQGQNLLTFTPYNGLDPVTQSAQALPLLRTFVIGFQIGL